MTAEVPMKIHLINTWKQKFIPGEPRTQAEGRPLIGFRQNLWNARKAQPEHNQKRTKPLWLSVWFGHTTNFKDCHSDSAARLLVRKAKYKTRLQHKCNMCALEAKMHPRMQKQTASTKRPHPFESGFEHPLPKSTNSEQSTNNQRNRIKKCE